MENVALQKILVKKAQSFGIVIDVSLLVPNLKANMEYAQSFDWGREFRVSGQAVRKNTPITPTNTIKPPTTTSFRSMRQQTVYVCFAKHRLPMLIKQITSVLSPNN
jgi:hypothetical protein